MVDSRALPGVGPRTPNSVTKQRPQYGHSARFLAELAVASCRSCTGARLMVKVLAASRLCLQHGVPHINAWPSHI